MSAECGPSAGHKLLIYTPGIQILAPTGIFIGRWHIWAELWKKTYVASLGPKLAYTCMQLTQYQTQTFSVPYPSMGKPGSSMAVMMVNATIGHDDHGLE